MFFNITLSFHDNTHVMFKIEASNKLMAIERYRDKFMGMIIEPTTDLRKNLILFVKNKYKETTHSEITSNDELVNYFITKISEYVLETNDEDRSVRIDPQLW